MESWDNTRKKAFSPDKIEEQDKLIAQDVAREKWSRDADERGISRLVRQIFDPLQRIWRGRNEKQ